MQKAHQVDTLRPSCNHNKMVNTVVQGVKALKDLLRFQPDLLLKCTEGGTKFVERTGQFAKVFEVDQLGGSGKGNGAAASSTGWGMNSGSHTRGV